MNVDSAGGGAINGTLTMTGDDASSGSQLITQAADVAIAIPAAVGTVGILAIQNLGANYIEISTGTAGGFAAAKFAKLRPGAPPLCIQPTVTLYAKANVADTRVKVSVFEE